MAGATLTATFTTADEESVFLADLRAFVADHAGLAGSFTGDHLAPVGDLTAATDSPAGTAVDPSGAPVAGAGAAPSDVDTRLDAVERSLTQILDHLGIGAAAGDAGAKP